MERTPVNGWWYPHEGNSVSGIFRGIGDATIGSSDYQAEIPALLLELPGGERMPIIYEGATWLFPETLPEVGDYICVYFAGYSRIPTLDGWLWRPDFEVSKL